MLSNKIHIETKIEDENFEFVCRAGCATQKAFQAADEIRSYLYGKLKEQEEQQKKAAEKPVEQTQG
jgi:hypothetical protein